MRPVPPSEDVGGEAIIIAKDQPEFRQLPARTDGFTVITHWQLTEIEKAMIAAGEPLVLQIVTFGHPLQPVHLSVGKLDDVDEIAAQALPCGVVHPTTGDRCQRAEHAGDSEHWHYAATSKKLTWRSYPQRYTSDDDDEGIAHG